jgi:hypothetical protein
MINQKDLENYKSLKSVINSGSYDMKGSAVIRVALLFKWFDEFQPKIEAALMPEVMGNPIQEVGGSDDDK